MAKPIFEMTKAELRRLLDLGDAAAGATKLPEGQIVPRFWDLVGQASADVEAVDAFDVRSEDAASAAEFKRLTGICDASGLALVKHVLGHGLELLSLLREGKEGTDDDQPGDV